MTEHPDAESAHALARRAEAALDTEAPDPELRSALDALVADRANGEPLGAAFNRLAEALRAKETP